MTGRLRSVAAGLELIFAACLWGFGFVAVVWGLTSWNAAQLIFLRFLLSSIVSLVFSFLFFPPTWDEFKTLLKLSALPGLSLAVMLYLQTWGLKFTTATKSGFITIMYVVLVPIFESLWWGRRLNKTVWACVLVSLCGVWLIVDPHWDSGWNLGDFLTFLCAIVSALQILFIDRLQGRIEKMFLFNGLQSVWGVLLLAVSQLFDHGQLWPTGGPNKLALGGLLVLAVGCTSIAFYLQVKAQRILSPTVSSLFFLLESPFALLFAFFLLGERLALGQAGGATLIMFAAIGATYLEAQNKKRLRMATPSVVS